MTHRDNISGLAALLLALAVAAPAAAQPGDDDAGPTESLELTIMLMPENATTPESVTRVIELPAHAAAEAAEKAADGLDQANAGRARREDGLDTAAAARENGREFGQAMRELAQENREAHGRAEPPANPGGPPPAVPGPPVTPPGPPQN